MSTTTPRTFTNCNFPRLMAWCIKSVLIRGDVYWIFALNICLDSHPQLVLARFQSYFALSLVNPVKLKWVLVVLRSQTTSWPRAASENLCYGIWFLAISLVAGIYIRCFFVPSFGVSRSSMEEVLQPSDLTWRASASSSDTFHGNVYWFIGG